MHLVAGGLRCGYSSIWEVSVGLGHAVRETRLRRRAALSSVAPAGRPLRASRESQQGRLPSRGAEARTRARGAGSGRRSRRSWLGGALLAPPGGGGGGL